MDLPADTRDLALTVTGGNRSDGVYIHEGWVVDLPPTGVDFTSRQPGDEATDTGAGIRAYDGFVYAPDCLVLAIGEGRPAATVKEFALPALLPGSGLRALVGLSADTPAGAKARVSFEFIVGEKVVGCVTGIELTMKSMDSARTLARLPNTVTIVEAVVPRDVRDGKGGRLRVTAEALGDKPATVLLPCLRITAD